MISSLSSKRWLGRTEFRTLTIRASPGWKAQTIYQSAMVLFPERMRSCAQIVLDTAGIVRDGDFSPAMR